MTGSEGVQVQQNDLALGDNLLPGEKVPFYLEIHSPSGNIGTWNGGAVTDISLSIASAPTSSQYFYQDISISDLISGNVNGVYWANGTIINTGSQTATKIIVYGTFYNSQGRVVAIGWSDVTQTLAPGASVHFMTPAYDRNQTEVSLEDKVESFSLLVQLTSPILTGAIPTANPTNPAGSTVFISPKSTNDSESDQTLLYVAIIVVVVIVAVVAAFAVIIKRKPKEYPIPPVKAFKHQRNSRRNRK